MNIRDQDLNPDDPGHEPPDDDLHAGEYVLGVLDDGQRRQAQARIDAEPRFAGMVEAWEQRFAALIAQIEPVTAPAHVWPRVRSGLGWSPVQDARPGLWQSTRFWRGATVAALAAAAVVAAIALMRPAPPPVPTPAPVQVVVTPPVPPTVAPPSEPAPVTTLAADDGSASYLATIDAQRGRVRVMPVPAAADSEGRVPELWLIPAGQAPRSLGVIDTRRAREIQVPADLRDALETGSVLAVTLEPPGGAPQGVPTGPIVAKGEIASI